MSWWEDLKKRVDDQRSRAQTEAARQAARSALSGVVKGARAIGDDLVSAAEQELADAESRHAPRSEYLPAASEQESSADALIAEAAALERESRERRQAARPEPAEETDPAAARAARARARLAALKAKRAGREEE